VPADADEVDPLLPERSKIFSESLRSVNVKIAGVIAKYGTDLGNFLEDSRLIVYMHYGHEQSVRAQSFSDQIWIYPAAGCRRYKCHLETVLLQGSERLKDCFVFNHRTDQMLPACLLAIPGEAENGEIVALGSATCEDHLVTLSIDYSSDS
jgi:hypothetical protein